MTKTDIAHINGDLTKLQPSELAVLRDRIARADAKGSKNHQQAQAALRRAIAWWPALSTHAVTRRARATAGFTPCSAWT
jgi:hypothetical protein